MKISIRAYANLGPINDEIDIKRGLSVRKLLDKMDLPQKKIFIVLVNGIKSDLNSILKEGDSVSIFPFIGGG